MKEGSINRAKDVVVRGELFVSVRRFQAPHSQLTARVSIIAHVQPLRSVNVVGIRSHSNVQVQNFGGSRRFNGSIVQQKTDQMGF